MKLVFALALLMSSSFAMAAATCPAGSTTLKSCTVTPQPGDNEFAATLFDTMAVCQKKKSVTLVAQKGDEKPESAKLTVENRMGGVSYYLVQKETKFELAFATGTRYPNPKATFKITFPNGLDGSVTYTCN